MDIKTTFSCGDKAWVYMGGPRTLTVGSVRVEITESPGIERDGIQFDNYKAQSERREQYMCVETGIGSGRVWEMGKTIFQTREDCEAANAECIKRREKEEREARQRERREMLREEIALRARLARIEQIKAEEATP